MYEAYRMIIFFDDTDPIDKEIKAFSTNFFEYEISDSFFIPVLNPLSLAIYTAYGAIPTSWTSVPIP